MNQTPNYRSCQHFSAEKGGICKRAKFMQDLLPFTNNGQSDLQCRYVMPVPFYECPNPEVNVALQVEEAKQEIKKTSDIVDEKLQKLVSLNDESGGIYGLQETADILHQFRNEILKLKDEIKQEVKKSLEELESRVSSLEKIIHAEKRSEILLPNAEVARPQPVQRKSKAVKESEEYTHTEGADRAFHDKIKSMTLNQDILNEDFFKDLDLDDPI